MVGRAVTPLGNHQAAAAFPGIGKARAVGRRSVRLKYRLGGGQGITPRPSADDFPASICGQSGVVLDCRRGRASVPPDSDLSVLPTLPPVEPACANAKPDATVEASIALSTPAVTTFIFFTRPPNRYRVWRRTHHKHCLPSRRHTQSRDRLAAWKLGSPDRIDLADVAANAHPTVSSAHRGSRAPSPRPLSAPWPRT